MTINAKDLKSIRADLAQRRKIRLAAADDRDLSTKETILRLAPELRRMKRQGFTTAELVTVLKDHGLGIKGATLNRYLKEWHEEQKKTRPNLRKSASVDTPKSNATSPLASELQVSNEHDTKVQIFLDNPEHGKGLFK